MLGSLTLLRPPDRSSQSESPRMSDVDRFRPAASRASSGWDVQIGYHTGPAGEFHAREVPQNEAVHLWWFTPSRDALVLGSTQEASLVDEDQCRRQGVDVVRRRSGGGVVLLERGGHLWLDVVIPSTHPLWERDVTVSSFWLGEVWQVALTGVGLDSLVQHRSRLETSPQSALVCFAGRGPGEIFRATGEKVVGISQRRTRNHARFQCAVSVRWDPERLVSLLRPGLIDAHEIETAGSTLDIEPQTLQDAMTDAVVQRASFDHMS